MRRSISLLLIVCMLHISIYGAVADLAASMGSVGSQPSTVAAQIPSPVSPQETANGKDSCAVDIPTVEKTAPTIAPQKQSYRSRRKNVHPIALGIHCGVLVITAICGGYSIWSALQPQTAAPTDTCPHHDSLDSVSHQHHLQRHSSGESLLTDELPHWLNNNAALMEELGELTLTLQHGEPTQEPWVKAREHTYNALHNHGIATLRSPIVCDIKLGDGESTDTVTECRRETQRLRKLSADRVLPEGVDAQLWLFPLKNDRFKLNSVDFIARTLSGDQRYPALEISVDHHNTDHTSMRRQLLQAGNTRTLPEAIQSALNNRSDVSELLTKIVENMRQWNLSAMELKALISLVKGIFAAIGLVMTGDVECRLVTNNGELRLEDCTSTAGRRADRAFDAQEDKKDETVTFLQSLENPVKFDDLVVKTNVLSAAAALPYVLRRAEAPLYAELNQLRQDRCNPADRSSVTAVANTVHAALQTPNANIPEAMACDVMVRNGGIKAVNCNPQPAPESAVCGHYNGTFNAPGRVWIRPNGGVVIAANRHWDTTLTPELPITPTVELPATPTLRESVSLSLRPTQTVTPPRNHTATLPVRNTTTSLFWSNKDYDHVYVAEINQTSGEALNPRIFISSILNPMSIALDPKNKKVYWASLSTSKVVVGDFNTTESQVTSGHVLVSEQIEKIYLDYINKRVFYFPYQPNYLYVHYFDIDLQDPTYNGTSRKLYISSDFQFQGSGGFAIDGYRNKLYCRCAYEICVGQIDYSTQSVKDFRKITTMFPSSYPMDINFDPNSLYIYWRDSKRSIYRAKLNINNSSYFLEPKLIIRNSGYSLIDNYGGIWVES